MGCEVGYGGHYVWRRGSGLLEGGALLSVHLWPLSPVHWEAMSHRVVGMRLYRMDLTGWWNVESCVLSCEIG